MAPSPPARRRYGRRLLTRLVLSLLLGGIFVVFMQRAGLQLMPARDSFEHVRWWTVGVYFVGYTSVHYFRAMRWEYLLRPVAQVPRRRLIAIGFIGFLAIILLPFRMGEVVRPYLVREKGRITGSAALGTIAAERVLDGLYVAGALGLALVLVPRRALVGVRIGNFDVARVPQLGYMAALVFAAALGMLLFFLWKRALAERLVVRTMGLVSEKLALRLRDIVGGLADGLRSLPNPRLILPFTFFSAVYWALNGLTMWFLGWGCGLPMTFGQGFAVMGVLGIGILLPAAPGLFGAYQLSVFAALLMYFPREMVMREGAAYVFVMYLAQLAFHLLAGLVPLATEKISFVEAFSGGQSGS